MRVLQNWLSIPCAWCKRTINFISYHDFGEPDLQISVLNRKVFSFLGGNLSDQQISILKKKFIVLDLSLPSGETYIFLNDLTGDKIIGNAVGVVLTCGPDCKDLFDLDLMNFINDKIMKNGRN